MGDYQVKYWDQSSIRQGVNKFTFLTLKRNSASSPFWFLAVYRKDKARNSSVNMRNSFYIEFGL